MNIALIILRYRKPTHRASIPGTPNIGRMPILPLAAVGSIGAAREF